MLACTRLGAPHTVVFGGFSADSLSDRMNDMGCEVLVTQDEAWRRGRPGSAEAGGGRGNGGGPGVRASLVVRRTGTHVPMTEGRDRWYHELDGVGRPGDVPVRADGQRGPAVPDVHVGDDREAEGDRAHDRAATSSGSPTTHTMIFDLEARDGRVLVCGRHRLDHRAQLHRLRAAVQRSHVGDVRGHSGLSRITSAGGRSSSATG